MTRKTKQQPVRVNDRFRDKQGNEWRAIRIYPRGVVDLMHTGAKGTRFGLVAVTTLRTDYERISATPEPE